MPALGTHQITTICLTDKAFYAHDIPAHDALLLCGYQEKAKKNSFQKQENTSSCDHRQIFSYGPRFYCCDTVMRISCFFMASITHPEKFYPATPIFLFITYLACSHDLPSSSSMEEYVEKHTK
jgi:hypothetical protein